MTCCDATIAHVQRQRRDAVCPTCGAQYVADLDATIPRAPAPLADARVQVAGELALRPSRTPPEARRTHVEDAFTSRLRRMVVELRAVELDGAGAAAIVYRERVQTSGTAHLPTSLGRSTVRRPVTDRLHALADINPRASQSLVWLRAFGPAYDLARAGRVSPILTAYARELGTVHQHIAWTKAPAGAEVWARAALDRAMSAWWGEGLDGGSPKSSNEEPRPPVATGRALSAPPADLPATPTT